MRVLAQPSDLRAPRVCAAIGFFDGVHLGHQQVVRQMIDDARLHEAAAVIVTFDVHPNTVVAPGRAPRLIYPLNQRLHALGSLGADALWLIRFDRAFSEKTGEQFVREMVSGFGEVNSLCVGGDFSFGHQRSGDVALLKRLGAELKFTVHGLASVALDGEPVRSTRVRERIRAGDFDGASQMLGRAYSLCGTVVRGDGLGRQLGFPTANLDVAGLELPPSGVYAVQARLGDHPHHAALNIGFRPTLAKSEPSLQVEAHLLDFSGDLYGQEMELTFVARLRDEQKFSSPAALKEQIARDLARARAVFA
ncbi:MAG: bifunctional riboflavin kinase/FAD synthetase [Verrucomicrobia bacterium]|nr:bifunctional riboflavin kinase/FAD synthetase [Verrucomicrobiota bacterium]